MSSWQPAVAAYIQLRRSVGFQLRTAGVAFARFAAFLDARGAAHLTRALALEWAQAAPPRHPATQAQRLSYVRGFARYWSAQDPDTEVPPCGLLPHRPHRAQPYLYSVAEVRRLLRAARQLPPVGGLRGATYSCLLGLLAVTGMRLGEVLHLQVADVDLPAGLLTIRRAKFGKARLVPIHPTTRRALAAYAAQRDQGLEGRSAPAFFVSTRGTPLDAGTVHRTFYALSRETGLRGLTASHGPRLHDFRHRFAVQTLIRWYRAGQDAERRLPLLSTYLGHVHVADTYWYLTAYPALLGHARQRLEARWEVSA